MINKTNPNNFLFLLNQQIKKILPDWALNFLRSYIEKKKRSAYKKLSTKEVFTKIYEENLWGESENPKEKYFSGGGSRESLVVDPYIEAIKNFLNSFDEKPSIVDLGCGDFSVGSKVRQFCGNYIAGDIVESVIKFNKDAYKNLNVDFRVIDITKDDLPQAEIVFLRQVLQHLSNEKIIAALPQILSKYKYLILTEHLPSSNTFTPNLDILTGPETRIQSNSGLVLTSAPFNLKVIEESCLCEVIYSIGRIRTTMYRLN